MNKLIPLKTILLIMLVVGYSYFVYNKGFTDSEARRKQHYRNLANAQAISSQKEWSSKINSSIIRIALDRGLALLNN